VAKNLEDAQMLIGSGIHIPTRTIRLSGDVEADLYDTLMCGMLLLESKVEPITIELSTEGGDIYHGLAIYDRIVASPCEVTIAVSGKAWSAGSIILQAADHRTMYQHSVVMIHDGEENVVGSPDTRRAWSKHGDVTAEQMYAIYAKASGRPASYWRKKCKADSIFTAEQALEQGLADSII